MKVLLVHPGASMSTHDVFVGLMGGLKALGVEVMEYELDARIERSGAWLNYCRSRLLKKGVDFPPITNADILYHAGEELVARSLRAQPDVVLVVSAMYLHPDVLVIMRRAGLRVVILFTESPYDDAHQDRLLPWFDFGWTNERTSAKGKVRYLPHAWNPDVHGAAAAADADVPSHDVVFVGTGFAERVEVLQRTDWDGIDLGLYGSWDLLGSRNRLRKYVRGSYVSNEVATALYRRAKIGLNLYRTSIGFGRHNPRILHAESLNPRAYELASVGCFTVSDRRAEVAEVFGDLVPTFDRPEMLRLLLDRWLADEFGRAQARARLPAAVAAHTWHARARRVVNDLVAAGIGSVPTAPAGVVADQVAAVAGG
jgi:spore maturation protein CgeB